MPTFQHSIPAAYLGRFSSSTDGRLRKRRLWVRDSRAPHPFQQTAENVAKQVALYDLSDGTTVDHYWGYESTLPQALDALADQSTPLDGRIWLRSLVRFVAGLFVRWPDFIDEYNKRMGGRITELSGLGGLDPTDSATHARVTEFQLLLAPVMVSRWTVLHFPPTVELNMSDVGVAFTQNSLGERGHVLPLDPSTALVVHECAGRRILHWSGERWVADIVHNTLSAHEATGLAEAIDAFSVHAVYGPSLASVSRPTQIGAAGRPHPFILRPLAQTDLGCHQYDYFRALSAMSVPPLLAQHAADVIDWNSISSDDWTGEIAVEVLFRHRTIGGVTADGWNLSLSLAHGMAVQLERRAAGDFRLGARTFLDLQRVREHAEKIAEVPRRG